MVLPRWPGSSAGGKARPGQVPSGRGQAIHGLGGKGLGKGGTRRHRKILKDNIRGITKGDIRRLARRGGVKRISAPIYEDVRAALTDRLKLLIKDCACFVELAKRKTVTVTD
ncbi:Histone H4, partial [Schaereria dolodes]|nr:Histone H4 [Schaereria dolodes]